MKWLHFTKQGCALLFCLILIASNSGAYCITEDDFIIEAHDSCYITALRSNSYYGNKPVIIFFPGSGECCSAYSTIRFLERYCLYDDLYVDIVLVTLKSEPDNYRCWERASEDVLDFMFDKYDPLGDDEKFPIIVDAVSFGGYGGCFLTDLLMDSGVWVDELNLADACSSYCISSDWIRNLSRRGTRVNIYASNEEREISYATRTIISDLQGTNRVFSDVFNVSHGEVLGEAIHEEGLHAEWINDSF